MPSAGSKRQSLRDQGETLVAHGRLEEACTVLQRAVDQAPTDWRAHLSLGEACLQDSRLERASQALEACLRLNPSNARALVAVADVCSAAGRRTEAEAALRQALRHAPRLGQAWLRIVHLRRVREATDPDLQALEGLAGDRALSPTDAEPVHFALGKAYDDLDRRQEAFGHLKVANALHKARAPFDMKLMGALMERIAAVFDEPLFARCRHWGSDSTLPVFVVGLPRCGSTLLEQILASHPRASAVGELRTLPRIVGDLPSRLHTRTPFPECMRELTPLAVQALAADYLRRLGRDAAPDVLRICDKMLSNLLLVGLIAIALPGATVLHCTRDLRDLGLSMYMHSFSGSGVGYAYDLDDIVSYHSAAAVLMAHWRRVAPVRIVELRYEELVSEPERGVRAVIDAAGLEWDDRCLQFHASDRQVHTVSEWQVRQPIHNRSVGRWRMYTAELEALCKAVER